MGAHFSHWIGHHGDQDLHCYWLENSLSMEPSPEINLGGNPGFLLYVSHSQHQTMPANNPLTIKLDYF